MTTTHLTPATRYALIEPTLRKLFTVTDAPGHIESINYFILKEMQQNELDQTANVHLYNLLHLIQSISQLQNFDK